MNTDKTWDFIIIGSGAGGSTAFDFLTRFGQRVLMLEEGTESADTVRFASIPNINRLMYRDKGLRVALGFPAVTIGEGIAFGGSTEVNGGLFWMTPKHVVKEWEKLGLPGINWNALNTEYLNLCSELGVVNQSVIQQHDLDSEKLQLGANALGWKIVPVPRLAPGCAHSNKCPSGCPSGAKQSMSRNLLKLAMEQGGQTRKGVRVDKVRHKKTLISIEGHKTDGKSTERLHFTTKNLVVAAGAIESQRLLMQNKLLKHNRIGKVSFHANMKIIAKFADRINSDIGTIFTKQIHEFIEQDLLIMGANFNRQYLAMASSHLDSQQYNKMLKDFEKLALYTSQTRVQTQITDYRVSQNKFYPIVRWKKIDKSKMRMSLIETSRILFAAKAEYIILPFTGQNKCNSLEDAINLIQETPFSKFQITTVHLMSSLPISTDPKSAINENGFLLDSKIQILDASILPSSIGESPQGTIMSLVRLILNRSRLDLKH